MAGRDERINKAVGDAITGAYGEAGLTLETLAGRIGVSPTTAQRMASGTTSVKVSDFIKIAGAVELDPDELMERALRRLAKSDGDELSAARVTPINTNTKRMKREATETSRGALEEKRAAKKSNPELGTDESSST